MDACLLPNVGKEKRKHTEAHERTRESNNKKETKASERARREVVFVLFFEEAKLSSRFHTHIHMHIHIIHTCTYIYNFNFKLSNSKAYTHLAITFLIEGERDGKRYANYILF